MPFTSLHAVGKDSTELLLSLHFVPASREQQEAWEEAIAVATADLLTGDAAEYGLAQVSSRVAVVDTGIPEVALILVGSDGTDESDLAEAMPLLQEVTTAVCGSAVSTASILANSGKLTVALSEAFLDGELVQADAGTLVKMAKMKPL